MHKLISVIVPVYNVEGYVKDCVQSLLKQSYSNLEIILVDDGSTDNSGLICDELSQTDRRVKVIHKKNGGLSDARNVGIEHATGEFLSFVDSDDYLSTECINTLYNLLMDYNADISVMRLYKTYTRTCNEKGSKDVIRTYSKQEAMCEMLYARDFTASACAKLYKSELFETIRFPYGKLSEDVFTIYDVVNLTKLIVYSNEIGYYYYTRQGSIINSKFNPRQMDVVEALKILSNKISLEEYDLVDAYASQMVECTLTLLDQNPSSSDLKRFGIWNQLKKYRNTVIFDRNATNRVRAWALFSYLGKHILVETRKLYAKYKRKRGK